MSKDDSKTVKTKRSTSEVKRALYSLIGIAVIIATLLIAGNVLYAELNGR